MNRPSIYVRMAGSPLLGIPLALGGMWLIFVWSQGGRSVWFALIGCFLILKTISCAKQVRRYKVWRKEWDAMGTHGQQPVRRNTRAGSTVTVIAAALCVVIVVYWHQLADQPQLQTALAWLWMFCGVFVLARIVIGIRRLVKRHRSAKGGEAQGDAAPVSWMLSGTVDSPSREMAVKSLPDYAARVLTQ